MHECLKSVCLFFLNASRDVCYRMIDWKKGLELLNKKALKSLYFLGLLVWEPWYVRTNDSLVTYYRQDCRVAANCRYCFYSQAKNQVFRPTGATRCTDSGQTLQYLRAPGSAWLGKISRQWVQTGGNAAPQNIKNFHFLVKSRPAGATPLTDFQNV